MGTRHLPPYDYSQDVRRSLEERLQIHVDALAIQFMSVLLYNSVCVRQKCKCLWLKSRISKCWLPPDSGTVVNRSTVCKHDCPVESGRRNDARCKLGGRKRTKQCRIMPFQDRVPLQSAAPPNKNQHTVLQNSPRGGCCGWKVSDQVANLILKILPGPIALLPNDHSHSVSTPLFENAALCWMVHKVLENNSK
eukprot:1899728-Amphidinium_carterae.1